MENLESRRVYRQGYDPEYWENKSLSLAEEIDEEEAAVWLKHPCTQVLMYALQADIAGIVQGWVNGGYASGDSIDSTAQQQAKARGMAQACDNVIETVDKIGTGKFGE